MKMPKPVTIRDAELLKQMGYSTVCEDGKVAVTVKDKSGECSVCGCRAPRSKHICFDCYFDEMSERAFEQIQPDDFVS